MKVRARTLALAVALGVVAIGMVGAYAAWSMFPPSHLTPLLRNGLARALGAPVSLGRAELAFRPQVVVQLDNLVIGDPAGYVRPRQWPRGGFALARRTYAAVDLGALLSRRISLKALKFEDARVTLVRNETGLGNWEALVTRKPETSKSKGFELSLDGVEFTRTRTTYYDARDGAWFDVGQLDSKVGLNREGGRFRRVRAEARVGNLGGRTPWPIGGRPIEFTADVESQQQGARWVLRKVGIARGALKLTGHGTVEGPDHNLAFTLDQTSAPLGALLELLPKDRTQSLGTLEGKGTVRLGLQANGPMAHGQLPRVRARAMMSGGRLAFRQRSVAIEDLAFDLTATEQGADLARMTGRVGRSVFAASGMSRSWAAPRLRGHIKANADLADVGGFLPLPENARLAGRAALDLDGAGAPGPDFAWSGQVVLAGVAASGLGTSYPVTGVNGTIGLVPGRAWARGLRAQLGHSDMTIDGTIDQPTAFLHQAVGGPGPRDGRAAAHFVLHSATLDADELFGNRTDTRPLPRVRADGSFSVGSFKMKQFAGSNLVGNLVYQDGVTSIPGFALDAYQGRSRGTASIDMSDRAHPRYKVDATAEKVNANELISAWTPAKNIAFGDLQMTINMDGAGFTRDELARSLTANGVAQIVGGKLAGAKVFDKLAEFTGVNRYRVLDFSDLSAPFRVTRGRVQFDPIAVSSGTTDWLAKGSVGLDGGLAFEVAALVPPNEVRMLPANLTRMAGALLDPSGKLTLDFRIGGTVYHPTFIWDSQRTLSRLLGNGPGVIDLLVRQLGGNLADSLSQSKSLIEVGAGALLAQQEKQLVQQITKDQGDLGKTASNILDALFNQKPPTPPPPPADTALAPSSPPATPVPTPAPVTPVPTPAPIPPAAAPAETVKVVPPPSATDSAPPAPTATPAPAPPVAAPPSTTSSVGGLVPLLRRKRLLPTAPAPAVPDTRAKPSGK